jgi:hypothetical protein
MFFYYYHMLILVFGDICLVGGVCLLGRKALRFCFVKCRRVVCDGLCHVTFSVVNGDADKCVHFCPVEEESLDLCLNG